MLSVATFQHRDAAYMHRIRFRLGTHTYVRTTEIKSNERERRFLSAASHCQCQCQRRHDRRSPTVHMQRIVLLHLNMNRTIQISLIDSNEGV